MKVLQLISSGGFYGAENVVLQLSRKLPEYGIPSVVGAFRNRRNPHIEVVERAAAEGLEQVVFDCAGRFDRRTLRALVTFIRANGITIVHSHNPKSNLYALVAARITGAKVVSTCHTWHSHTFALKMHAALDMISLRCFDKILSVSDEIQTTLRRVRVRRDNLRLIENGLDFAPFHHASPTVQRPDGHRVVGVAARLAPEKGIEDLVRAAAIVLRDHPRTTFIIAGHGPERDKLIQLAANLGIASKVQFLGSRPDMPGVFASMDAFVLPSYQEGMPMALIEAMASRLPVVATSVGDIPKLVVDGETGLLVTPGAVERMAACIARVLDNPGEAAAWARAGAAKAQARHSAERMTGEYAEMYRSLVEVPVNAGPALLDPTASASANATPFEGIEPAR